MTMTHEERGFYILLLCLQWTQGRVKKEDVERLGTAMAQPSVEHVLSKFKLGADRGYRNARMEEVRGVQNAFRANRSESGKFGAMKRWHSHSTANGQPMANDSSPSPSPSPSPLKVKSFNGLRPKAYRGKLTLEQLDVASRLEKAIGENWENDKMKWMKRCRVEEDRSERVMREVESAIKESRIKATPAQYAEQIWKEFS